MSSLSVIKKGTYLHGHFCGTPCALLEVHQPEEDLE
jgi:hypothetical protein